MNLHQAMSLLQNTFPEVENRDAHLTRRGTSPRPSCDEHEFARFVAAEMAHGNRQVVQQTFERMEELLYSGDSATRDWVCSFIEALRDLEEWKDNGTKVFFFPFLGPQMRRAWVALDAIRADLAECSVLETEVTMWRAVHHSLTVGSAVHR